jgi:hypothetical protein
VVARVAQAEVVPDADEGVVHADHLIRGNVDLPAELTDVGDTGRAHARGREPDLA